jgi:hypothetical protein
MSAIRWNPSSSTDEACGAEHFADGTKRMPRGRDRGGRSKTCALGQSTRKRGGMSKKIIPIRPADSGQFLLAASRQALQKLETHFPNAPETALLRLAIQKLLGVPIAEG